MTSIFITGIGRGIGFELARQALDKGWEVAGSVRSDQDRQRLAETLPAVSVLEFDVTDFDAVENAAATFSSPIDILINNAGIIGPARQSTADMDFDGFAKTLQINSLAPLKVSQAFLPHLKKGRQARLITISSRMGLMQHAQSDHIAYRASKSTVNKIMQALATDLEADNICVIAMHPGWVQSDMGGPGADISVGKSAAGILKVISGLDMSDTGQFINWDGQRMDW